MYKGIAFFMISWGFACIFSLFYNLKLDHKHQLNLAMQSARAVAQQMQLGRQWNRSHGMIYAPITEKFQPSEHILLENRDLTTTKGIDLTMVNSSVMIRQMSEIARSQTGVQFRSISLKPLNADNLASNWEVEPLKNFKNPTDEYYFFGTDRKNNKVFHYMKASDSNAECIKCHGISGYKEGDILGATSIDLPFEYDMKHTQVWLVHATAMLSGFAGLLFFNFSLKAAEAKISKIANELAKANNKLAIQNKEMSSDLVVAEKLQKHLFLSHSPPSFLELHVVYNPLSHVSGDLVKMSQSLANGNYKVFIGDGSGHGIAAAFTTIMAKMSLDQIIHEPSLARQLEHLNTVFSSLLPEDRYLSGILINVSRDGLVRVVNAGHPPIIILKNSGEIVIGKEAGIPLGMFDTEMLELNEEIFNLEPGDRCFLITDGITERLNHSEERYGLPRLKEALTSSRTMNFNQLIAALNESIETFAEGREPDDDVTMIAFEFKKTDD